MKGNLFTGKREYLVLLIFIATSLSFIIVIIKSDPTTTFEHRVNKRRKLGIIDKAKAIVKPKQNIIYFHKNPILFVDTLANCLDSTESWICSVLFHHLGKTGGSVLRDKMFDNYPPNKDLYKKVDGEYWDDWMKGNMTAIFKENRERFCRAKFSSYQDVNFKDIVLGCKWLKPKSFQLVALIPFREPTSRTVSSINHFCNKVDVTKRSSEQALACGSCNYKKHHEFFDSFATLTNNDYTKIREAAIELGASPNVKALMYDLEDIHEIFLRLKLTLPNKSQYDYLYPIGIRNKGQTNVCDFGMNSNIIKQLAPSYHMYRKFTRANLHINI